MVGALRADTMAAEASNQTNTQDAGQRAVSEALFQIARSHPASLAVGRERLHFRPLICSMLILLSLRPHELVNLRVTLPLKWLPKIQKH